MSTVAPTTSPSVLSQSYIAQRLSMEHSGPTVLIATGDATIERGLAEALESCGASVEFARGLSGVREIFNARAGGNVSVCLCGFGLQDGSYRDVVSYPNGRLRRCR